MTTNHSAKQLEFYYSLCSRKARAPKDTSSLTIAQLGQEIEYLLALPMPASAKQRETLTSMLQELVDAGIPGIRMPSRKFFDSLTMDSINSWFEKTRAIRGQHFDKLPANEQQIDRISAMYLFPEVEWETYNINIKIFTSTYDAYISEEVQEESIDFGGFRIPRSRKINGSFVGESNWRMMTHQEFCKELKAKLTHASASAILDRYTGSYNGWLRTRLTDGQKRQIRQIENRLASIFVPKEVTVFEMDQPFESQTEIGDTNFEADTDVPFVESRKTSRYNPVAYTPIGEAELGMYSREEADKYISQLRYELQNQELRNIGGAQELSGDFEQIRTAKDVARARTQEFDALNNFLFGLSDIVGSAFESNSRTVDSLRHEALQTFFDKTNGASQENKDALKHQVLDFIRMAVESKAIKFMGLMNLADKSDLANEFIDELIEDQVFAQKLMKLQRSQY